MIPVDEMRIDEVDEQTEMRVEVLLRWMTSPPSSRF
jgi:hypothetical protein